MIRTAKPGDLVSLDPDEPAQPLRCQIEQFQFSAHASRESIIRYVKQLAPKKIVLVHGDAPAVGARKGNPPCVPAAVDDHERTALGSSASALGNRAAFRTPHPRGAS